MVYRTRCRQQLWLREMIWKKISLEVVTKNSEHWSWGDDGWQTVPEATSSDRKRTTADSRQWTVIAKQRGIIILLIIIMTISVYYFMMCSVSFGCFGIINKPIMIWYWSCAYILRSKCIVRNWHVTMLMSIIMMTMVTTTINLSDCSFYEVIISYFMRQLRTGTKTRSYAAWWRFNALLIANNVFVIVVIVIIM